jgi:ubiquitin carboxyl-terminal hydrolase 4/11/15
VYREELNPDNPLGMSGQVAEAFGTTIEHLWGSSSQHSSYAPRTLKSTTSRFAPQFAGYGQHDTQEFIAFLLDGLHEDLNRIKKKPYVEKPDWKAGGGDVELAELGKVCWDGYKKRNDSVIVDLFQGQLQSTLVCPECRQESITMDPVSCSRRSRASTNSVVYVSHSPPTNRPISHIQASIYS